MTPHETGEMRIWKDRDGRLWTLADSGLDTEIFEPVGDPIYNEATGFWYQQIQLRSDSGDDV